MLSHAQFRHFLQHLVTRVSCQTFVLQLCNDIESLAQ